MALVCQRRIRHTQALKLSQECDICALGLGDDIRTCRVRTSDQLLVGPLAQ